MPTFSAYPALSAHAAPMPDMGRIAAQRMNMMAQAMQMKAAQNQLADRMETKQREAAVRNAFAAALDPDGSINQQRLMQGLAAAGGGEKMLGVRDEFYKAQGSQADAGTKQVEYLMKFNDATGQQLSMSTSPQDAAQRAQLLKQMFPAMAPQVDTELSTMPADPAAFGAWRSEALRRTMAAKDQLAQHFVNQTNGTDQWVTAMPEYGGGAATEVPGSRNTAPQGIQYTKGPNGEIIPMPKNMPVGGGGAPGGGADTVFGNGKYASPPQPLSSMPIGQVMDFQRNSLIPATRGKIGKGDMGTGAVGLYQITNTTLGRYAPKVLGANWQSVPFTAEVQDRLGRAIYEDAKNGDLHLVWEGMPSNKPGEYANVPWEQVRGKIAQVESGGGSGIEFGKPISATTPEGVSEDARQKKVKAFQLITGVDLARGVDPVETLIRNSTSGKVESWGASLVGALPEAIGGGTTPGMQNIGKLKVLANTLLMEMMPGGRLSTGVSDEDRKSVKDQIGTIDDPSIPADQRLAAWQMVKQIMARNAGVSLPPPPPPGAPRAPSAKDAEMLRQHPSMRNKFDEIYGAGAAAKVLGR